MSHPTPDAPATPRQTGPKTPAGKAKSKMNAAQHGLRAASGVLPGEDPAEYDLFVTDVVASLAPVGALERELAGQAAAAIWRLRRTHRWEAARARLVAHADPDQVTSRLARADEEIAGLRAALAAQQRDPAADPPLAVRLAGLPDPGPVDPFELDDIYEAWAGRRPGPEEAPGLGAMCERAGLPPEAVREPYGWAGWTAGDARRLVEEFARDLGIAAEQFLTGVADGWRAGLSEERARRRRRRAELRREIGRVEERKVDLVADRAAPDGLRLDLLARYEAAAHRAFDRAVKALLALRSARRPTGQP